MVPRLLWSFSKFLFCWISSAEAGLRQATWVLLSKTHLIFRIINFKNRKRTTKSAEKFTDNLKTLFGKTKNQDPEEADTMDLFRQAISSLKNFVRRRWTNVAWVYCTSNFYRFCSFFSSMSYFVSSKSTWGKQPVEDVSIFKCICVYVSIYVFTCVAPPGLTKNETDLKFGTHTPLDNIQKRVFCFFENVILRAARLEKLQCHVDFQYISSIIYFL